MSLHIACQNCGQNYKVSEKVAGKRVKCKKCGGTFAVPRQHDVDDQDEYRLASMGEVVTPPARVKQHAAVSSPTGAVNCCKNCGAGLPPNAVLCVSCGFDIRTGRQLDTVQSGSASPPFFQMDGEVLKGRFSSGDRGSIAARVDEFFRSQGYRLEYGTSYSGVYGVGSDVMRILFGAFARRYKFKVEVGAGADGVWISVTKGMSGAMGGLLGHSAMKRETSRILVSLQAFLEQQRGGGQMPFRAAESPPHAAVGYGSSPPTMGTQGVPHRGGTILTLAIIGFFCFGIILGPVAWSMAHRDLREMKAGRMDPSGLGLTQAGQVCAIIVTVLGTLGILFVLAAAVLGQ